jgi:hypothetical protein
VTGGKVSQLDSHKGSQQNSGGGFPEISHQDRLENLMTQLVKIGGKKYLTAQKFLVNRIEKSIKGQRRIEKHL